MVKNFKKFTNDVTSIMVADYKLNKTFYDTLHNEYYGVDEDELKEYLLIIENYQKIGGEIQRIIFSYTKPNLKKLGNSWTHINNNWENYIQSIFDFNYENGKINGDEGIWLIIGTTPPNNIAIQNSLEQFQNNPEEQELTIINSNKINIININKVK